MQCLFLCRFDLFTKSETNKHTVQRTGMSGIRLVLTQLAVKLAITPQMKTVMNYPAEYCEMSNADLQEL